MKHSARRVSGRALCDEDRLVHTEHRVVRLCYDAMVSLGPTDE